MLTTNCSSKTQRTTGLLTALLLLIIPAHLLSATGPSKIGAFGSPDWLLDLNGNFTWDGSPPDGNYYWSTGQGGEVVVYGDWNGDGRTKMGVYANGTWLLDYNGNGVWDGPDVDKLVYFGGPGYVPVVGDWNGSGTTKIGAYDSTTGTFLIDYNGNFAWDGPTVDRTVCWSLVLNSGEIPVIGDWNGSGTSKIGIYSNGTWLLDYNGNYAWDGSSIDKSVVWSIQSGETPVVGDWKGSHTTKIGVYFNGDWLVDYNGDYAYDQGDYYVYFGGAGFVPVVGDWTASGTTKIAAYASGSWLIDIDGNYSWDPPTDISTFIGGAGQTPVVGNWPQVNSPTQTYTITSFPVTALAVQVDNVNYTTPQTFQWAQGSQHTLNVATLDQFVGTQTEYAFNIWSDLGAASHSITVPSYAQSYVANFNTLYQLTTSATPANEGTITPASGWYNSGSQVTIAATASSGYTFGAFTVNNAPSPSGTPMTLTMTAPENVVAYFQLPGSIENPIPTSVSLTAASGATSDSFTFTGMWSDTAGAGDLSVVEIVITPDPTTSYLASVVNACHIRYLPAGNTLQLDVPDEAHIGTYPYSSPIGPNGGQTLYNGVCIVDAANSTSSPVDQTETLTVPITLVPSQSTPYLAWTSATTNDDVTNNWIGPFWSYTAPASAPAIFSNSLTVNGGSLGPNLNWGTFTAVFTDAAGVNDISGVDIDFSPSSSGASNVQGCHVQYIAAQQMLFLYSAASGNNSYTSSPLGVGGQALSNGVCDVDASQSSVTASGNTLTFIVAVTFTTANSPQLWAFTSLTSLHGSTGWTGLGFFQAAAIPGPAQCSGITPLIGAPNEPNTFTVTGVQGSSSVDFIIQLYNQYLELSPAKRGSPVAGGQSYYTLDTSALALGAYRVTARLNGTPSELCPAVAFFRHTNPALKPIDPSAVACNSVAGTWTDSLGPQWTLSQSGNTISSGSAYLPAYPSGVGSSMCPANTWQTVTGVVNSPSPGAFSLSASNPVYSQALASDGQTECYAYNFSENEGTIGGANTCDSASGTFTSPSYTNGLPFTWTRTATLPNGESSSFIDWLSAAGWPTLALFKGVLSSNSGLSFAGRSVNETDAQPATDTCWFPAAELVNISKVTGVSGGTPWNVQDDNSYQSDYIGFLPDVANFYQAYGSTSVYTACTATVYQQMQISVDNGAWQNYGAPNVIMYVVDHSSITNTRGPACTYPGSTSAGCASAQQDYSFPQ